MTKPSKIIRMVAAVILGLIIGFFVQDYLKATNLDLSLYKTRLSNEQKQIINTELSKVSQDISKVIDEQGYTIFAQDNQNTSNMPMRVIFQQLPNKINPQLQNNYEYPYFVCKDSKLYPFQFFDNIDERGKSRIVAFACKNQFVIEYTDPTFEIIKYYGPFTY